MTRRRGLLLFALGVGFGILTLDLFGGVAPWLPDVASWAILVYVTVGMVRDVRRSRT